MLWRRVEDPSQRNAFWGYWLPTFVVVGYVLTDLLNGGGIHWFTVVVAVTAVATEVYFRLIKPRRVRYRSGQLTK
jgi:hypothetical protein